MTRMYYLNANRFVFVLLVTNLKTAFNQDINVQDLENSSDIYFNATESADNLRGVYSFENFRKIIFNPDWALDFMYLFNKILSFAEFDANSTSVERKMFGKVDEVNQSTEVQSSSEIDIRSVENRARTAWAYLFGIDVPVNFSAAFSIFEELSESGNPEGHAGIGFMHAVGLGTPRSEPKALVHWTVAALGGSNWGRMALGYRYLHGIGVPADCEQALAFYRPVAEDVALKSKPHQRIKSLMSSILDEADRANYDMFWKVADLKYYYSHVAEKGDVEAQFSLGHMLYHGALGIKRDLKKALHYFKLAESNGILDASAFIGKIYLEGGEDLNPDYSEAFRNFEKAAQKDNTIAQTGLGIMYMEGLHVERDYRKAFYYLNKSAHRGWFDALVALARMFNEGLGVPKDVFLARKYLFPASQAGHILALYQLGKMDDSGYFDFRSCLSATSYYKSVAERGQWDDLFVEAYRKFKKRKYKEAFVIYAVLSEIGYSPAQSSAAMLLDDYSFELPFFEGSENDRYLASFRFWRLAAMQGEERALNRIGDHFYYGLGVEVDFESAFDWYRRSALTFSNAEGMYNLGFMHERGLGMVKDINLADRCYQMSLQMDSRGWVPVRIALLKLKLGHGVLSILKKTIQYLDLIVIAILTIILMWLIYRKFNIAN